MHDIKTENPGAAATASGVKSTHEAAKLLTGHCHSRPAPATHFWDERANCIAPICELGRATA